MMLLLLEGGGGEGGGKCLSVPLLLNRCLFLGVAVYDQEELL